MAKNTHTTILKGFKVDKKRHFTFSLHTFFHPGDAFNQHKQALFDLHSVARVLSGFFRIHP